MKCFGLVWSFFCLALCGTHLAAAELAIGVVDPNPALLTESGAIISADTAPAVDLLAANFPSRTGIASDGVSLLLLRVRSSNAVTFALSPRVGILRGLDGATNGMALTVQPRNATDGTAWTFALYAAPDDLPGARVRREVMISARSSSDAGVARITVENPPVLLVHGLWSDDSAWNGLRQFLIRHGSRICEESNCIVNYGATQPAPSFDPFTLDAESQFAINNLIRAVTNTLATLRRDGVAVAQVDVVAHSLGGLLARARVALPDAEHAYRRRDNFQRGDFHKLVTIGTPHRGTPAAGVLAGNRDAPLPLLGGATLGEYLASSGRPIGPAIFQMQPSSAALTNLGVTVGVPSHAVIGLAPAISRTEKLLDGLLRALEIPDTLDDLLGGNKQHDTIVPRDSQAGGLSGSAITLARGTVHTDVDSRDTSETESRRIWNRVAQLLRAPPQSSSFGNFTVWP
jgi:pimeloyl-ACP methyl ester carboxylesterase